MAARRSSKETEMGKNGVVWGVDLDPLHDFGEIFVLLTEVVFSLG